MSPSPSVAFLGPRGTFSQVAALNRFGPDCRLLDCATIDEVFDSVEDGRAAFGVAPVENSTEGVVNNTQDRLIDTTAAIAGEEIVPVELHLLVAPSAAAAPVRAVASHRQSLAQCRQWLRRRLPDAEIVECVSNADAARRAGREEGVAAIAGTLAAREYGLRRLHGGIQDRDHNSTRFLVIADAPAAPTGRDKTSVLVSARDRPGALFRVLEPFERLKIGLTKIDSRPSKRKAWEYVFFIDFEGHVEDDRIKELFERLESRAEAVKVLGSYPAFAARSREPEAADGARDIAGGAALIVGLGLIGGSVARGLRRAFPGMRILAADPDGEALAAAAEEGTISAGGELDELLPQAGLVIIACPPRTAVELVPRIAAGAAAGAVVTDACSVKSAIAEAAGREAEAFRRRFVPGHPVAGSERSGFAASDADLFRDRDVILTPLPANDPAAVARVNALWRALGADVTGMGVRRHDRVLAATSHLPHLLAYALVDALSRQEDGDDIFRHAAGGFAGFSRIASSDPAMWSDILTANAREAGAALDALTENLAGLGEAMAARDRGRLKGAFARARRARDRFVAARREGAAPAGPVVWRTAPGGGLGGELTVPGDKSISHRAALLGAIADGVTKISGFLEGEDTLRTVAALREMGVTVVGPEDGGLTVYGVGLRGLAPPRRPLDMGNAGTAMRLLAGLLAAQDFDSELIGDASLSRRPMDRVVEPLAGMGARIRAGDRGVPPLTIRGGARLRGTRHAMPVASAQVKSCLLLAGLYAEGRTIVTSPAPCRDHTERMLAGFGRPARTDGAGALAEIAGGPGLRACAVAVPADISSAAFFMVAAAVSPGSRLLLRRVGVNPTRAGVIDLLRGMGADIRLRREGLSGGEPVADVEVRHAPLRGIEIPPDAVPSAIDEFPALLVAAACAEGETVLRGAAELRVKESDRIEAMAAGLRALGVGLETFPDGMRVAGGGLRGGAVDSRGDHRVAMAFAVAGCAAAGPVVVRDCAAVATSFPGFPALARRAGIDLTEVPA